MHACGSHEYGLVMPSQIAPPHTISASAGAYHSHFGGRTNWIRVYARTRTVRTAFGCSSGVAAAASRIAVGGHCTLVGIGEALGYAYIWYPINYYLRTVNGLPRIGLAGNMIFILGIAAILRMMWDSKHTSVRPTMLLVGQWSSFVFRARSLRLSISRWIFIPSGQL